MVSDLSASEQQSYSALARAKTAAEIVADPELPFLSLADMGILRDVRRAADGMIEVVITPTYSGCPAMDMIRLDLEVALARANVGPTRVVSVLSPAWTTAWLTAAARAKLLANGIAPPEQPTGKAALFSTVSIGCPKCGSERTRLVSRFSSTACKAQWACLACLEPFEQFKCI
jgi:ring-1,2-phenylacetyl-CoA epoxidase subunit PaaD